MKQGSPISNTSPIATRSPISNVRPGPDQVLLDIADYVLDYRVASDSTVATARLCLTDALAGALDALDFPECTRLLGPLVPGTVVPHGARVPGTRYELDPSTAAFSFGCMIRWLDFNDQFSGKQGSHPSDTLAGILMLADHLSRQRQANGRAPLLMREVLDDLIKAYEIQGGVALENDLEAGGVDHNLLTRVATTAVLARMLGATRDQVVNAVSNAWMDCSPVLYRHAPNTGWRKSWACADASSEAVRLAMMALKGEMGYPSVLTAQFFGLYDARFSGSAFKFQRPYGEYIIQHSTFKFVPAGAHGQSAVECAFRLHPLVKERIEDIERIDLYTHAYLLDVMHKTLRSGFSTASSSRATSKTISLRTRASTACAKRWCSPRMRATAASFSIRRCARARMRCRSASRTARARRKSKSNSPSGISAAAPKPLRYCERNSRQVCAGGFQRSNRNASWMFATHHRCSTACR